LRALCVVPRLVLSYKAPRGSVCEPEGTTRGLCAAFPTRLLTPTPHRSDTRLFLRDSTRSLRSIDIFFASSRRLADGRARSILASLKRISSYSSPFPNKRASLVPANRRGGPPPVLFSQTSSSTLLWEQEANGTLVGNDTDAKKIRSKSESFSRRAARKTLTRRGTSRRRKKTRAEARGAGSRSNEQEEPASIQPPALPSAATSCFVIFH